MANVEADTNLFYLIFQKVKGSSRGHQGVNQGVRLGIKGSSRGQAWHFGILNHSFLNFHGLVA